MLPWVLLVAVALCFGNGARGPFIFDDWRFVMDDPPGFWMRPVLWGTILFNRWFSRVDALGYHLVNLVIHGLAGLTLFGLLRRTLVFVPGWRESSERSAFACAVVLVWLVHPLQTESVTYLSGRSEALAGLCYLFTLYAFVRSDGSTRARAWQALAALVFAVGMGVKEVLATAPIAVVLYDRVFLSGSFARALGRRRAFYATLLLIDLACAAFLIVPQLLEENSVAGFGVGSFGPWAYLKTEAGVLGHYLALSFWPDALCLDYWWPAAVGAREFVPQALVLCAALGATIWGILRGHPLAFAGAWFFVVLSPTSSFVPQQDPACDRRMYLPLAGVVVLVLAGVWRAVHAFIGRTDSARQGSIAVSLVLAGLLGVRTVLRNETYASPIGMWRDVVAERPDNWRAHLHLGTLLGEAGRYEEAIRSLERSAALLEKPNTHLLLGNLHLALKAHDSALAAYDRADSLRPEHAETLLRRGNAHLERGDAEPARVDLERAFALEPTSQAQRLLGLLALRREAWSEAERHFREALARGADDLEVRKGLARSLVLQELHAAALTEFQRCLESAPDDQELHTFVGATLSALERPEEALGHFRRALELSPNVGEQHFNLGRTLETLGRNEEAERELRRALDLGLDGPYARELLARVLLARPAGPGAAAAEALELAREAAALTQYSKPRILETLSAAYAATGDRARARETLSQALALASPENVELQERLAAKRAALGEL